MAEKRVTQADVAKEAGVHRTSVSLAFKRHPSIPAETRKRIIEIAKRMGYAPDPMLSALASYRTRLKTRKYQGTLAWLLIDYHKMPKDWHRMIYYVYYQGAKRQAKEHGYNVEVFEYNTSAMSAKRMAAILRARNVNGILLSPQPAPYTVRDFMWDDFSLISFGYSLMSPRLNVVTSSQYHSTFALMERMREKGYRRIAFAFDEQHDARVAHQFSAGYLAFQKSVGDQPMIYPYVWADTHIEEFLDYYKKEKPDAVITGDARFAHFARALGLSVPGDLGIASPLASPGIYRMTGFDENSEEVGAVAVDRLADMIFRGEKGIPKHAHNTQVDGVWVDCGTI
ncbi:LacI family DNA-binding transcriptional regulator [Ruficoccus sp. ZRK36]|uniref:LacI family DNA-binding transcriptional regulator n=1 Tax=Ruficoccus sp. ZRK36 TaxID=2866311 RepID=UPI001C734ADF|nr:LacI family DNA-binding transcriptional regulator [Ruficoccus sp. ZRK36]QYY35243.1 LacI family transcriptional regulator [Ruficoccus sp. ZRK36]